MKQAHRGGSTVVRSGCVAPRRCCPMAPAKARARDPRRRSTRGTCRAASGRVASGAAPPQGRRRSQASPPQRVAPRRPPAAAARGSRGGALAERGAMPVATRASGPARCRRRRRPQALLARRRSKRRSRRRCHRLSASPVPLRTRLGLALHAAALWPQPRPLGCGTSARLPLRHPGGGSAAGVNRQGLLASTPPSGGAGVGSAGMSGAGTGGVGAGSVGGGAMRRGDDWSGSWSGGKYVTTGWRVFPTRNATKLPGGRDSEARPVSSSWISSRRMTSLGPLHMAV